MALLVLDKLKLYDELQQQVVAITSHQAGIHVDTHKVRFLCQGQSWTQGRVHVCVLVPVGMAGHGMLQTNNSAVTYTVH